MINAAGPCKPEFTPTQLTLFGVISGPVVAGLFCLLTKARGKALGTSDSRWIRNASDWVAFFTWTGFVYAIWIAMAIYAHFACR
jgi:hypothetical protein